MPASHEPVAIGTAINAAILATLAVLAFAGVSQELIGAIGAAATAWVATAGIYVRSRVTPTAKLEGESDEP